MPRSGGIYTLPSIYHAESGTTIMPQQHNIPFEDVAQALTGSLPRDGSAPMNANLPMNGRKITGLADGTAASDAAAFGQIPVLSPFVESLSGLTMVANRIIYSLNNTTAAMAVLDPYMRDALALGNASAVRTYIGAPDTSTASTSANGLMSSADKAKLNGIAAGAQVNVPTNLGINVFTNSVSITNSNGTNATIPRATSSDAGLMGAADKSKLDGIAAGAQVNVPTNLGYTSSATTGTVTSSTGANATIPVSTTSVGGLMSAADKTKLDGIAAGAQVNVPTNLGTNYFTNTISVTSSTGTNTTIARATTTEAGVMGSADKVKLDGIESGAQVNVALASQAQAEAGSNNTATMTPLRVEQHMLANALGWGQSWATFNTSARNKDTNYQNTTGRPILVSVTIVGRYGEFLVGPNTGSMITVLGASGGAQDLAAKSYLSVIVPSGNYYSVTGGDVSLWAELR